MDLYRILSVVLFLGLKSVSSIAAEDINRPLECEGVKTSFRLEGPTGEANSDLLKGLPYIKNPEKFHAYFPGRVDPQLRLDICALTDGTYRLQRVILNGRSGFSPVSIFLAEQGQIGEVENLEKALFGDVSKFHLMLTNGKNSGVVVAGTAEAGWVGVVDLYRPEDGDGAWEVSALDILVGQLVPGDPFVNLKCRLGQRESHSVFELGTAQFEADLCLFMGGGETTGYTVVSMSVTDTNKKIAKDFQGRKFVYEGASLVQSLNYKWNHHNGCDSFVLKVPELNATYSVTSGPMAGCGTTVPGAPQRSHTEGVSNAKFENTYGKKTEKGLLKNGHYFKLY